MTMDISRLGIEVESKGIKESSDALGGLSRSAGTAEKRVAALMQTLTGLAQANSGVVGSSNALGGAMGAIAAALVQVNNNVKGLTTALGQATAGLNNTTAAAHSGARAFDSHSRSGGVITTTLKAMATAALAYFSVNSARNIVEQADSWGMMQAKLKLATGSMQEAREVQGHLFTMAQNMRAPLEDMGKLYTRLAPALGRMGKSAEDTRNMVEGVTLALKLGGATSGEAASTMLQFSQAANAGRLNGAEFNSVAENGVVILRALEDHLGKNQAELKKMGAEGTLTFDLISEALEKQLPKWREDFKSLPITFEGAMQRIKNAWFKAVGETGQETELGKKLAESLLKLEAEIPRIAETVVGAFTFMVDHGGKLATMFGLLMGLGVAKWATEAVLGFTALAGAARTAGGAMVLLRTGMAFLTGPIGILTGLVVAGTAAWMAFGDKGQTASTNLTTKTVADTETRIRELNREIQKLNERNAAAGAPAGPKVDKQSDTVMESMQTLIKLRTTYYDPKTNEATKVALKIAIDQKQVEFERLMSAEQAYKMTQAHTLEVAKQKKLTELAGEERAKLATGEKKALIEIEEMRKKFAAEGGELPKDIEAAIREKYTKANTKAVREENAAVKEANTALEKQRANYAEVTEAYKQLQLTRQSDDKRTTIQKEGVKLEQELKDATSEAQRAILRKAVAENQRARGVEQQMVAEREMLKAQEDYTAAQDTAIAAAEKEAKTLQDKVAGYGLAKGALEDFALSEAKLELLGMGWAGATEAQIAAQQRLVDALQAVKDAKESLGQFDLVDDLNKKLAALKPADFGTGFADAFGKVGGAIDKAGKSLDQYSKKMNTLEKLRKEANNVKNEKDREKILEKLRKEEENQTLDMYADMAGAAKDFFDEKTVAYKAFNALEQGLRVVRIAEELREFAVKQMAEQTWLGTKIATVMAAMGWDATETASSVANSGTKAAASTIAGAAKAFEQMGVYGFIGAAAILAFMGALGAFGGGGGGGGPSFDLEKHQEAQNTGTVLGDDTAKSESIANALETMRDNSNIGLVYTSNMLVALRNIEMGINGLTASVSRANGITTGKNFNIAEGENTSGGFLGISSLFGKSVTKEILDAGLKVNGTMAEMIVQQYVDVQKTTKKSGFFGIGGGTKTEMERSIQDVSGDMSESIRGIFGELANTVATAGEALGGNASAIRSALADLKIEAEVSLKDLKGEDLEAALNDMFSAAADTMAGSVLPAFRDFQRAGEGYFETITRVASSSERAQNALEGLGIRMVDLNDVVNKSGDVGVELVRQSLLSATTSESMSKIIRVLDGGMEDLIDGYRILSNLQTNMTTMGLRNMSLDLIRGAGGLSELDDAFGDFFEEFYTDGERAEMAAARLQMEFGRLGKAVPASKEAFRALVTQLMAGDAASQELAGRVLTLSGVFAEAMEEDSEQAERVADARDVLSEAYEREADALESIKERMEGFSESLGKFRDTLIMGDLSPLSALEKYQTALARYEDVSKRAKTGDESAIADFERVANELLGFSRDVNASGSAYMRDFERVLRETEVIKAVADEEANDAERSLELLRRQVEGLITIDESVKSVVEAIRDLRVIEGQVNGSHANGLARVPFDGYVAELHKDERVLTAAESQEYKFNYANYGRKSDESLVNEIKTLRQELTQLRQDQREHTGNLIASNYDANQRNAEAVVEGTKEAATDAAYATRNPIGLT